MLTGFLNIINNKGIDYCYCNNFGLPATFPVQIDIQRDGISTGEKVIINNEDEAFALLEKHKKCLR